MSDQRKLLETLSPKSAFFLGFAGSLGIVFFIGFFVLLGVVLTGKNDGDSNYVAGNNVPAAPSVPSVPAAPTPTGNPPAVGKDDHTLGPKNAKVVFVEFSDIQCPYCGQFHPTVNQITKEYPKDVLLVYKHFPLDSLHPNARPAAEASECVAEQKGNTGFFAYLNSLYSQQQSLSPALYLSEAKKLGVNEKQFTDCVTSRKYQQRVEADYQQGLAAGIQGTPGGFINNQVVRGAQPYAQVKAMVDSELSK